MLKYIMANYDVEFVLYMLQVENILRNKLAIRLLHLKERSCLLDSISSDVHPRDITAHFCKRQQIATLTASSLQYIHTCFYSIMLLNIWNKISSTRFCQFLEILLPVFMTLLHDFSLY